MPFLVTHTGSPQVDFAGDVVVPAVDQAAHGHRRRDDRTERFEDLVHHRASVRFGIGLGPAHGLEVVARKSAAPSLSHASAGSGSASPLQAAFAATWRKTNGTRATFSNCASEAASTSLVQIFTGTPPSG
nr:hypothetical protein [uncultured Sutterella sp.]